MRPTIRRAKDGKPGEQLGPWLRREPNGTLTLARGKMAGQTLDAVAEHDEDWTYLRWMLEAVETLTEDCREAVENALAGAGRRGDW